MKSKRKFTLFITLSLLTLVGLSYNPLMNYYREWKALGQLQSESEWQRREAADYLVSVNSAKAARYWIDLIKEQPLISLYDGDPSSLTFVTYEEEDLFEAETTTEDVYPLDFWVPLRLIEIQPAGVKAYKEALKIKDKEQLSTILSTLASLNVQAGALLPNLKTLLQNNPFPDDDAFNELLLHTLAYVGKNDPNTLEVLFNELDLQAKPGDPKPEFLMDCFKIFQQSYQQKPYPKLLHLLKEGSPYIRSIVLESFLGQEAFPAEAKILIPELARLSTSQIPQEASDAAYALQPFEPWLLEQIDVILKVIPSCDPDVRDILVSQIIQIGPTHFGSICEHVKDLKDEKLITSFIRYLYIPLTKDKAKLVNFVEQFRNHENLEIRYEALTTLLDADIDKEGDYSSFLAILSHYELSQHEDLYYALNYFATRYWHKEQTRQVTNRLLNQAPKLEALDARLEISSRTGHEFPELLDEIHSLLLSDNPTEIELGIDGYYKLNRKPRAKLTFTSVELDQLLKFKHDSLHSLVSDLLSNSKSFSSNLTHLKKLLKSQDNGLIQNAVWKIIELGYRGKEIEKAAEELIKHKSSDPRFDGWILTYWLSNGESKDSWKAIRTRLDESSNRYGYFKKSKINLPSSSEEIKILAHNTFQFLHEVFTINPDLNTYDINFFKGICSKFKAEVLDIYIQNLKPDSPPQYLILGFEIFRKAGKDTSTLLKKLPKVELKPTQEYSIWIEVLDFLLKNPSLNKAPSLLENQILARLKDLNASETYQVIEVLEYQQRNLTFIHPILREFLSSNSGTKRLLASYYLKNNPSDRLNIQSALLSGIEKDLSSDVDFFSDEASFFWNIDEEKINAYAILLQIEPEPKKTGKLLWKVVQHQSRRHSQNWLVNQSAALRALIKLGTHRTETLNLITGWLKQPLSSNFDLALGMIPHYSPTATQTIPFILPALKSLKDHPYKKPETEQMIEILGSMGIHAKDALGLVNSLTQHQDEDLRNAAIAAKNSILNGSPSKESGAN